MSTIQKHWLRHAKPQFARAGKRGILVVDGVVCRDGFRMSVQASAGHYCRPRELLQSGKYTAWEIAFPNKPEPLLMPFISRFEDEAPEDCNYNGVPTEVVDAIIAKHGGLEES